MPSSPADVTINLSSPFQFSINNSIKKSIGITGDKLYEDFKESLNNGYSLLTKSIRQSNINHNIITDGGTANLHPSWSPDGKKISFISNADNDFFGQTDLFVYDMDERVMSTF